MRTALTSDEELARCQARISEFKKLGRLPDGVDDEAMWEAQRTVNAIIHGPTGEKMFLPGRMSMFVPMNVPATAGMIMARAVPLVLTLIPTLTLPLPPTRTLALTPGALRARHSLLAMGQPG